MKLMTREQMEFIKSLTCSCNDCEGSGFVKNPEYVESDGSLNVVDEEMPCTECQKGLCQVNLV